MASEDARFLGDYCYAGEKEDFLEAPKYKYANYQKFK